VIVYRLRCDNNHEFEGWFRSGASFDAEIAAREHACPQCGSTVVAKAPMAPAIGGTTKAALPAGCPAASHGEMPPCAGACGCFGE